MRRALAVLICGFFLFGCDNSTETSTADTQNPSDTTASQDTAAPDAKGSDASTDTHGTPSTGLPVIHTFEPERARRGAAMFTERVIGRGLVPDLALRNLWVVWGTGPLSGSAYWERFRERYGMHEAPFDNGDYPMGIRDNGGGQASFDCLLCHGGRVAGQTLIGVANSTLDLQGLHDDLVALNTIAPNFGFPSLPVPFELIDRTGAAGATDAFGLGMEFSLLYGPSGADIEMHYGYQQPYAWWTMRFKDRIYSDGSGSVLGARTMMATLLAFGLSFSELQAMDEDFEDIRHYLLSLEAPKWPQTVDSISAERGGLVYDASCAECHGNAAGGFPERRVPVAEVGTDPLRAERFTAREEAWINASWFGDPPMSSTGAYVAPPLTGIWARAPYFHNGSIPTLAAVLDPSVRPTRWQRTGSADADFDFEAVGWRYSEPASGGDPSTLEGRKIYDTDRPGLSAAGHVYGEVLSAEERTDLIEYLKTL